MSGFFHVRIQEGKWLSEIDRVEDFDTVVVALKQLANLADHTAFRVLSIRIEKKVNYFYEVTTSD